MKKIIVTGGMGFIGSNLIKYLINQKYFVINIDKLSYSSNKLFHKEFSNNKNYKFYKSDLNNRKKMIQILKKYKPYGIFNLAAETHVDRSIDDASSFIKSNILGTYNLLEAILFYTKKSRRKIKLLHISTDEVYGDLNNGVRSNEKFPYDPSSPYSATKAGSDHLVKSYVRTYKLDAVISNCCNNYGGNQLPEKFIPKLIFNIINNKSLPVYGKGNNSREWMHVQDHCKALLLLFFKGKTGESYNIGSGQNYKNIEIVKKLLNIVAKKSFKIGKNVKIIFVKDRPGHDVRYALNSKKIFKKLKWKTTINLENGLSNTFDWYLKYNYFYKSYSKKLFDKRLGLKKI